MIGLYAFQLALPLALIVWLAVAPARSRLGFAVQSVASAATLAVMALRGIWLLPPWWAPYAFAAALGWAAWLGLRRARPFASALPATWVAGIVAGFFTALGALSGYGTAVAWRSRTPPPLTAVNLAFPLESGLYLVVNGGSDISTNAHLMTLDSSVARFQEWRGQSHGVDIVRLDVLGLRARSVQPAAPSAYRIHGARVLAPCAGQVVVAVDGLPDMQVPEVDREHLAGNHVLLRCTNTGVDADVLLGHLRPGSVLVRAGTTVAVGDGLGAVGNSGNTAEPHLHVHAQRRGPAGAPLGGDPFPILFNGRFPVRGNRIESP
jgi:Peptidase family M23